MSNKYTGVKIKITEQNLTQLHKRVSNFVSKKHSAYTQTHGFDQIFRKHEPYGVIKEYDFPAREVELHVPGSESHRSDKDFIRVVFECGSAFMIHVGDEIFFTKDSITVKSDWHKNWGATPSHDPNKFIFLRLLKQPKKLS